MDNEDFDPTPGETGETTPVDLPAMPPAPPEPGQPEPWVEVPTPMAAPKERNKGLLVAVVILVVIGLIAIVMLTQGGGPGELPDELAGQPRVTSGPAAEVLGAFDDLEVAGVSMDLAIYGTELAPAYMVMSASGDLGGGAQGMLSTLPTGMFSNAGAQIDFSKSVTANVDGVEYVCAPATNTDAGMNVSMCLYSGDDLGGVVMSFTASDLNALMSTTQDLVAEIS